MALISYSYNVWSPPNGYDWYIENDYHQALANKMKLAVYASWGTKKLWGLVKRRQAEINYILN